MTLEQFKTFFPRAKNADMWVQELNLHLPRYDINTSMRLAAFLSQCGHESAGFTAVSENLNYSGPALIKVFKKYFPSVELAERYARKPEQIANRVYGGRMGNGPESTGDGWKFRGRGLIQLTGRSNYQRFADFIAEPAIVKNPDLVSQPSYAVLSACWFWTANHLNVYADSGDVELLTRRINGGLIGLTERRALYNKILTALT